MLRDLEIAVLSEAAARSVPLVLSIPSDGCLRHSKSRFFQMSKEGIWIESVAAEKALLTELTLNRCPVGVTFKSGPVKFLFSTRLISVTERFRLHVEGATVAALRLEMPQELKTIQRRAAYRTRVLPKELSVAVWRIEPEVELAGKPLASQRLHVGALDVSLGGLGVVLRPINGQAPLITPGERLRTELSSAEGTILLEGRLRGGRPAEEAGALIAGIQWVLPQDAFHAAHFTSHLEKLVNRLQRQELRRGKFGGLRAG